MTTHPLHTLATAPEASKPALRQLEETFGTLPNIARAMANSPVLLNAFVGVFAQVHGGNFSEAEIQVVLLTDAVTNASPWAVAFHSALALRQGVDAADVEAIRRRALPSDARLASLAGLAKALIEQRGHVADRDLEAFLRAGYRSEQALEILTIVAASTMTNYAATLASPPLEPWLEAHAWTA